MKVRVGKSETITRRTTRSVQRATLAPDDPPRAPTKKDFAEKPFGVEITQPHVDPKGRSAPAKRAVAAARIERNSWQT